MLLWPSRAAPPVLAAEARRRLSWETAGRSEGIGTIAG
jgi:hypothetical protein